MLFLSANNKFLTTLDAAGNLKNVPWRNIATEEFQNQKIIVYNFNHLLNVSYKLKNLDYADFLQIIILLFPTLNDTTSIHNVYNYMVKNNIIPQVNYTTEVEVLGHLYKFLPCYIETLEKEQQQELYNVLNYMEEEWVFYDYLNRALDTFSLKKGKLEVWNEIKNLDTSMKNFDVNAPITLIKNQYNNYKSYLEEERQEQSKYIELVNTIFNSTTEDKNILILEAGTGVGKTLGYLIPAINFIKNNPYQKVLISTYSKSLQNQVASELKYLKGDQYFNKYVAIAKGKNNFICLRNYRFLLENIALMPEARLFVALIYRWLKYTDTGDFSVNINPSVFELFSNNIIQNIMNDPKECTYSSCPFYKKCFVMKNIHKYNNANIVISNHSFTLKNKALGIKYTIFDEAHHLFNTADDVYSVNIGIQSLYNMKEWILGKKSRNTIYLKSSLKDKIKNLLNGFDYNKNKETHNLYQEFNEIINILEKEISFLPDITALYSIPKGVFSNVIEEFLFKIYKYTLNEQDNLNQGEYTLESLTDNFFNNETQEIINSLKTYFNGLLDLFETLVVNLGNISVHLPLESITLINTFFSIMEEVCISQVQEYLSLLDELTKPKEVFVYRFLVIKDSNSKIVDIAYYKNYINANLPLSKNIFNNMNGVLLTSATLNLEDKFLDIDNESYFNLGINYLYDFRKQIEIINSPFDYSTNSKVIILQEKGNDNQDLTYTMGSILSSSEGGALIVFTSIKRLISLYKNLNEYLGGKNINLFSQHINNSKIDNIISLFKYDINSCLLGTDLVRDGIDIPGNSLRMVLLEKVPWVKPDILFNLRRKYFKDDNLYNNLTSTRIKQAFGRLIRKKDDKGILVLLNRQVPDKLLTYFHNKNISIEKLFLEDAKEFITNFYK